MKSIQNILLVLSIMICLGSCTENKQPKDLTPSVKTQNEIKPELQVILDSTQLEGSILIHSLNTNTLYSNDFNWKPEGVLPASTFKIVNSIIGLETGVIEHDSVVFHWDGESRGMEIWEQDLSLKKAFHYSCVPCYQEVALEIGAERMNSYVTKLNYGDLHIDDGSIDNFWLQGDSKITQLKQIDFLKRLYLGKLPISHRTQEIMNSLMVIEETDTYKLWGKTGWSIRGEHNNGWFVGYIKTNGDTYFFATNIEPKNSLDMSLFPSLRKKVTLEAFMILGFVK